MIECISLFDINIQEYFSKKNCYKTITETSIKKLINRLFILFLSIELKRAIQ